MEKGAEEEQQQIPVAAKEEEEQQEGPAAAKEQQKQDDDERYHAVAKIKLVYERERVKGLRVIGNLNNPITKMIMSTLTPHIEMRVKVIDSFKLVIYQRSSEIKPYSKTLDSSSGMFTSLKEIEAYIEECEQSWLDLDNEKVWSKLIYSPQEQPKYEAIMKVKSFLSMFK